MTQVKLKFMIKILISVLFMEQYIRAQFTPIILLIVVKQKYYELIGMVKDMLMRVQMVILLIKVFMLHRPQ
jgi:hypothetical protein